MIIQSDYINTCIGKWENSLKSEVNYKELGQRIKSVRQNMCLTQDNLSEMVGCNTSHISNIENNYTKLSLNVLVAIANALGVSVDYLLSGQLNDTSSALDREILKALDGCDDIKKEKILKIISIV